MNRRRFHRSCLGAVAGVGLSQIGPIRAAWAADDAEARIRSVESGLAGPGGSKATLAERMAFHKVPGVSIAVIQGGKIDWARGYGVLEAGGTRAVSASTLFQAASISKCVAAMAAMVLVQDGKIGLDDDVNTKLRTWKIPASDAAKGKQVTLRMLLSHSAGLTVHGFGGYAAGAQVPTLTQVLDGEKPANSAAIRVELEPGTKFQYSGGGYCVIQQLIEDVSGEPFPKFLHERVLAKIGMKQSAFDQPIAESRADSAASGHLADGSVLPGRWRVHPELAAAGLWTTPTDLARYCVEVIHAANGKLHNVLTTRRTLEVLKPGLGHYGLGVLTSKEGAKGFSHGGANAGFRCILIALIESGLGMVIMTNSDHGDALHGEIVQSVLKTYAWPFSIF